MNEKFNMRFLNRLMYFGLTLLIAALSLWVLTDIGFTAVFLSLIAALLPVLLAIVLAYLVEPIIGFLIKRKIKRIIAVVLVYLFLAGIVALAIFFLIPPMIDQFKDFFDNLPNLIAQIEVELQKFVGTNFRIDLSAFFRSLTTSLGDQIVNYIFSVFSVFYTLVIAITGAIFLSADFPHFRKSVKKIIPSRHRPVIYPFFHDFLPTIHRYISAILLNVLLLFGYATLILFLFDIKFPVLFALIIALTKLIPVIGSYIGALPLALVGFAVSFQTGLINIAIVILIQAIESNIVSPIVVRGQMKIKPIENLIGVALLGKLFGFLGMIATPIVISGIKIAIYQHQLRLRKLDPTLVDPGDVADITVRAKRRLSESEKTDTAVEKEEKS